MFFMRNVGSNILSNITVSAVENDVSLTICNFNETSYATAYLQPDEAKALARYLVRFANNCEQQLDKKEIKIRASELSKILDFRNRLDEQFAEPSENDPFSSEWIREFFEFINDCEKKYKSKSETEINVFLEKVKESKNLHHVKTHFGMTFLAESYADDKNIFGLVVKHPANGFDQSERKIIATIGGIGADDVQMFAITPAQFFQLRELLNLRCQPWTEDE